MRQRKEREKLIKKWSRETETEGMEDRERERERERGKEALREEMK